MKLMVVAALSAALLTSPAFAGGTVIEEEYGTEDRPAGFDLKDAVPFIVGAIVICALACGGDDEPVEPPPVVCFTEC